MRKNLRASEVKRMDIAANTSCSVFVINSSADGRSEIFNLLIDVGQGVVTRYGRYRISSADSEAI